MRYKITSHRQISNLYLGLKFCLLFILLSVKFYGQNLVPNPSFEIFKGCPLSNSFGGDFYGDWYNLFDSPDYFNSCDTIYQGVPRNFWGYQPAFHGNGYSGIATFINDTFASGREYIQVRLISKLKKDSLYCASFWTNPANDNLYYCNDIGMLFTDTAITYGTVLPPLNFTPQITNQPINYLGDTTVWYKISGQFIAKGGEEYLTIGNFKTNLNSSFGVIGGMSATSYYYVDSVNVSRCGNVNGIDGIYLDKIKVFPNPIKSQFTILGTGEFDKIERLVFYSSTGKILQIFDVKTCKNSVFYLTDISPGIYFITLTINQNVFYKKVIVTED